MSDATAAPFYLAERDGLPLGFPRPMGRVNPQSAHMSSMNTNELPVPRDAVGQEVRFGDGVAIIRPGYLAKGRVVSAGAGPLSVVTTGIHTREVEKKHLVLLMETGPMKPIELDFDISGDLKLSVAS